MSLEQRIGEVQAAFDEAQRDCRGVSEVEGLRIRFLGRQGEVRELFSLLGALPAEQKKDAGLRLNELKKRFEDRLAELQERAGRPERQGPRVDATLPGIAPEPGRRHPLYRTWDDICRIFLKLGFDVEYGPEIEDEFHNFDALNIPRDHAARDAFDTFYIEGSLLLRSHTSPVQIRAMKARRPPIRIIAPGKVFRPDTPDAGHSPMFHQVEGLMVGEDVSFAHLKGVLDLFAKAMWGPRTGTRFRPSFFPFTEPSADVEVTCVICGAKGCPACKHSGWMEILGSGMVHPRVLENCGIDPERYTGFAFGMGIDRICMLRYRIPDIRLLFENHFSFLEQF